MTISLSITAILISIGSLVLSFRNSRRSQRLEFSQRRDQLLHKIADLNATSSDTRLISSKFGIYRLNLATRPVLDEADLEETNILRAKIREIQRFLDLAASNTDERVNELHSECGRFTLDTARAEIDNLIAQVQIESDRMARTNGIQLATLHTIENTDRMDRASTTELLELKKMSSELDQVRSIMKLDDTDAN